MKLQFEHQKHRHHHHHHHHHHHNHHHGLQDKMGFVKDHEFKMTQNRKVIMKLAWKMTVIDSSDYNRSCLFFIDFNN